MPTTTETIRKEQHRQTAVLTVGVLICVVLVGVAQLVLAIRASHDASNAAVAAAQVRDASARQDCRSEIGSVYAEITDTRDTLNVALSEQLAAALLNSSAGVRATQADVDRFAATKKQLDDVVAKFNQLPSRDDAVKRGVVIEGKKFGPCPTVGG